MRPRDQSYLLATPDIRAARTKETTMKGMAASSQAPGRHRRTVEVAENPNSSRFHVARDERPFILVPFLSVTVIIAGILVAQNLPATLEFLKAAEASALAAFAAAPATI
jgi:hypothetical protein